MIYASTNGMTVMWSLNDTIPRMWFPAAAAVSTGNLVMFRTAGSAGSAYQGGVMEVVAAGTGAFGNGNGVVTTQLTGLLIGVAINDAVNAGDPVGVDLFTSYTGLILPDTTLTQPGSSAPAKTGATQTTQMALMANSTLTTYYGAWRGTGNDWYADLGVTSNGWLVMINLDPTTFPLSSVTTSGQTMGQLSTTSPGGIAGGPAWNYTLGNTGLSGGTAYYQPISTVRLFK